MVSASSMIIFAKQVFVFCLTEDMPKMPFKAAN